jgi:hypothetical protein
VRTYGSVSRRVADFVRALFLRSNNIRPALLGQRERFPRTGTTHRKRTSDIHGLAR